MKVLVLGSGELREEYQSIVHKDRQRRLEQEHEQLELDTRIAMELTSKSEEEQHLLKELELSDYELAQRLNEELNIRRIAAMDAEEVVLVEGDVTHSDAMPCEEIARASTPLEDISCSSIPSPPIQEAHAWLQIQRPLVCRKKLSTSKRKPPPSPSPRPRNLAKTISKGKDRMASSIDRPRSSPLLISNRYPPVRLPPLPLSLRRESTISS